MIDCRPGSSLYEIAIWEEAEMLSFSVYELQEEYEKEWNNVAYGRYRSV